MTERYTNSNGDILIIPENWGSKIRYRMTKNELEELKKTRIIEFLNLGKEGESFGVCKYCGVVKNINNKCEYCGG